MTDEIVEAEQRPSIAAIHRCVQNVLYNELDVSKAGIKSLIKAEVTGIAAKSVTKESVQTWVMSVIEKVTYGRYGTGEIKKMIEAQVKKSAEEYVKGIVDKHLKDRLTITINTQEPK
jgi:hypothetical protein